MGKINKALAALPWVEEHSVDFQNKMATIVVDAKTYDEAATIQAVQSLGFGVSVM